MRLRWWCVGSVQVGVWGRVGCCVVIVGTVQVGRSSARSLPVGFAWLPCLEPLSHQLQVVGRMAKPVYKKARLIGGTTL